MNIVLLQAKLKLEEIEKLLKEFPQYLFLSLGEDAANVLQEEQWSRVEIFYGNRFSREELFKAHQLKWVHLSTDDYSHVPLGEVRDKGGVLITATEPPNIEVLGEFITSAILSFSKNLFRWKEAVQFPSLIWDCKWKESMWRRKEISSLHYGLNSVGAEIAKQCKSLGFKVWGVQEKRTFHPYCFKTVSSTNVHSILPSMDVVILSFPKGRQFYNIFTKNDLDLMKKEALLVVVGNNRVVDEKALVETLDRGRLRGVVIDLYSETPLNVNSLLWKRSNVLITPDISHDEDEARVKAFQTFRYNMRQYLHGNINDMHNKL